MEDYGRPRRFSPRATAPSLPVSAGTIRLGIGLLALMSLSMCSSAAVNVMGYLMPRSTGGTQATTALPSADSFDPNAPAMPESAASAVDPAADPTVDPAGASDGAAPVTPVATVAAPGAASRPPSARPTENTGPYKAAMKTRADAFRSAYDRFVKDSNDAAKNPLDFTLPAKLKKDADAVASDAGTVAAVKPPQTLAATDQKIDAACRDIITATGAFKTGMDNMSKSDTTAAFNAVTAARGRLEQALRQVPA